ncbi:MULTISPECIES: DNA-binding protein [Pseudomonas]|uniref:DNA-binding protein n=1 Tax=Pseudomonas TaxID=286 RepID=UPI000CFAA2D8|nr:MULTISPECIES: DNA-binding protein [Pseudomonas]KAF1311041.1 integrase [Pseudomonas sp. SG-MS2]NNA04689.1 integrase [Pseudomonas lundensis]PRA71095.1 integrase [Pseudomonas sp. MYb187]
MARGGVNLAVVQKARNSLLMRGAYPSIDAVRVEIGNTGSKTTIARYLKQLESVGSEANPRERMSGALRGVVESLLDQVQEEGSQAFLEARAEFEHERKLLISRAEAFESELDELKLRFDAQGHILATQTEELKTTQSTLQTEITRNVRLTQSNSDFEVRIQEKDGQIQSLEQKHTHAREALEHYRASIKEQRDQDLNRHESQVYQMQQELTVLQQTLMVKQEEITRLIRDNERFIAENRQHAREASQHRGAVETLRGELSIANAITARAEGAKELLAQQLEAKNKEAGESHSQLSAAKLREVALAHKLTTAEAELIALRESSEADGSQA